MVTDSGVVHKRRMTGEQRRDAILQAALELFAERGYSAATTRELAARAGISEAVIYRHFRSKEEVLREVFERNSFLPHLREFAALDVQGPLRDQLAALGRHWRAFIRQRHHLAALVLSEMHRDPQVAAVFRDTLRQGIALVVEVLRAHADPSLYRTDRLPAAARVFFAELMWQLLIEGPEALAADNPHAEAQLEETVDLVVDGLKVCPGADPQTS